MACRSWRWPAEPCPCHTRPRPSRPSPLLLLSPPPKEREEATGNKANTFLVPLALFPLSSSSLPSLSLLLALVPMARTPNSNTAWQPVNHPGSGERREERGRETGSGGCLVIYGSHSSEYWVKLGNGRGEKTGRWKGREVGDEERDLSVNSEQLLGCFWLQWEVRTEWPTKAKLLVLLMRFWNWLPQDLPFSAWVFRSVLSSGCGDKIWSFVSIYKRGALYYVFLCFYRSPLLSNIYGALT
jgi:hypothetical protein